MEATTTTNVREADGTTRERSEASSPHGQATGRTRPPVGIWIGRGLSGLVIAFLLMASALPKFLHLEVAAESMRQLGWQENYLVLIGSIEVVGAILYAIPRTAALGAVLLTALFGGAVASQLRIEAPLFSHTLFPVYVGALTWAGLWLRSPRVREVWRL